MNRRSKREVALPPQAIPRSSLPPQPIPHSTPPLFGAWFSTPPPGWFAAAQQKGMPGSFAQGVFWSPPTGGGVAARRPMADLSSDLQEWGMDSRPPGGFLSYFNNPLSPGQHVNKGSPSQPINVDSGYNDGDVVRIEKRLSWTKEEDERLVAAWLNNSNDPIESNFKKNEQYWKDVTAVYKLWASGESNADLMDKAKKTYEQDYKDGPFMLMHC